MKITNKHGVPDVIYDASRNDRYSKGNAWKSVTGLIQSPKVDILRREHDHEIEEDVSDRIWSLLGTAVHHIIEEATEGRPDHVTEERIFAEIDGVTISGAIDRQVVSTVGGIECVELSDYKCTSVYAATNVKPEWHQQLNLYAWLIERTRPNTRVTNLSIVAILRDWSRRESTYRAGYPPTPIVNIPIGLWSFDEREKFVRARIAAHLDAERSYDRDKTLPDCTPVEQWRDERFQLWRSGGKRPLGVYRTRMDAERASMDGYTINVKYGEPKRCKGNFCKVRDWCEQYKRESDDA